MFWDFFLSVQTAMRWSIIRRASILRKSPAMRKKLVPATV
jgi:hypothetical protein